MFKKILIAVLVIVIIVVGVWFLILNPKTSVTQIDTNSGCYGRCQAEGFDRGVCMNGGSGVGSGCSQAGGRQISDRENPIPGCSFEAIGSWQECCCF